MTEKGMCLAHLLRRIDDILITIAQVECCNTSEKKNIIMIVFQI